ncbi:MAG TPA: condensation domain-containing protein, partial [Gemmatimonadaceae bacterium]|nr:condensation domain-containing protein [Gemmatimonadaceae bacterium]
MSDAVQRLAELSPEEKRLLLARLLREKAARVRTEPASFGQQRLWFMDQLVPGSAFYTLAAAVPLHFAVDPAVLQQCLSEIVRRHEVLRTTFSVHDGQPVQVIHPPAPLPLPLPLHDLRALPASARSAAAAQLAAAEAQRPFDLRTGPLLRAHLVRLDETEYVFLLTAHHIVADGWSLQLFGRELGALYPAFAAG